MSFYQAPKTKRARIRWDVSHNNDWGKGCCGLERVTLCGTIPKGTVLVHLSQYRSESNWLGWNDGRTSSSTHRKECHLYTREPKCAWVNSLMRINSWILTGLCSFVTSFKRYIKSTCATEGATAFAQDPPCGEEALARYFMQIPFLLFFPPFFVFGLLRNKEEAQKDTRSAAIEQRSALFVFFCLYCGIHGGRKQGRAAGRGSI